MVASTARVTLTFGGRRAGEIGPAPRCKAPVTATATVTGTAGLVTPTGNVTLTITSRNSLLDPFPHTLDMPLVRCTFHAKLCTRVLLDKRLVGRQGMPILMSACRLCHVFHSPVTSWLARIACKHFSQWQPFTWNAIQGCLLRRAYLQCFPPQQGVTW